MHFLLASGQGLFVEKEGYALALSAVVRRQITACVTVEIIDEYEEIVQEMIARKQGHLNSTILTPLINAIEIMDPVTRIKI